MTLTDELRRMLDERGVEWDELPNEEGGRFTRWKDANGRYVSALDCDETQYFIDFYWGPTPQQAVDATLGRETCHNISPKLGNDEFTCDECLARVYGSGGQWFDANWKYHKFNYCPNCGREVVG